MQSSGFLRLLSRSFAATALLCLLASAPALWAQPTQNNHLVSPAQLQQQVENATATRQQNIDTLNRFVSTPQALRAMKDAKIDPAQVKTAIPTLSNSELADLSGRAQHAQRQFAAGGLGTLAIAIIIIAVVLIILLAAYH
ncbi:MAG: hypothetical protein WB974_19545 [Acidobacteriaceae bacterium]